MGLLGDEKVWKTSKCSSFLDLDLDDPNCMLLTIGWNRLFKNQLLKNGENKN